MNKSKVLIGAPVYDIMKYCINDFLKIIKNLDYEDYNILLVDNSRDEKFFNELKQVEKITVLKDNTNEGKNKLRLVSSRNIILNYAKENKYDYLLMMDVDVMPPKNIISELIKNNKEIVSGIYYNYFTINGQQKYRPVVWCNITPEEFDNMCKQIKFPPIVKSHEDIRRHLTPKEADSEDTIEVKIPSAGCMLISKKVFEKINYGLLEIPGINSTTDDIYFCIKAKEAGFKLYCNTKIKCEHLIKGKFYKDNKGNLRNPVFD
jgi:GT2 family glycosyltransferase